MSVSDRPAVERMTDVLAAGSALCDPFLESLPITGISISVVSERGAQSTVATSDLIAARLDELQFQLGEGPTSDVLRADRPVLTRDLRGEAAQAAWPMFSAAALDTGARGVFAFPLHVGRITVGVVSLYALVVLPSWSDLQVGTAVALAEAASGPAIDMATRSAVAESRPAGRGPTEMRREVHQAAGMLMMQLDCSIDESMARLRAAAFALDRPIETVARDVVTGILDFAALGD